MTAPGPGRRGSVTGRAAERRGRARPRSAPREAPAPEAPARDHPPAWKLMLVVAAVVALDILIFSVIGYLIGTQIL